MSEKMVISQCYSSPAAQPNVNKQLSIFLQFSRAQTSGQLSFGGWFQIIKAGNVYATTFILY